MRYYYSKIFLVVLFSICVQGCEPKRSEQKGDDNLTELKAEFEKLNAQVNLIQKQVNDIHEIAIQSQKPKVRKLANQKNYDEQGTLPSLGSSDANIVIIEFSDFQCPYCKRFIDQTFPLIDKNYIAVGSVKYLIRDFPLNFHPKAEGAAIAAICAKQQDSYWPFREQLFNNMNRLEKNYYLQIAQSLKLELSLFEQCLSDITHLNKIKSDVALGKSLGVTGTPSFIIGKVENNVLVEPQLIIGAQSYRSFSVIINELMAAK